MNNTYVTVSGVVATHPRAVVLDGSLPVTSFRLVSTSRRFDRAAKDWVDGNTLWLTVTSWRSLALNVAASVLLKDRVFVYGRLRNPEWTGNDGVRRSGLEIDAECVGHDLMFGTSTFVRGKRAEPLELPGRREADALARAVELEALGTDLSSLLDPHDGPGDRERQDRELEDGELEDGALEDDELGVDRFSTAARGEPELQGASR